MDRSTLILTRSDLAALMTPADYREAVARAFIATADRLGVSPHPLQIVGPDGGFHVKGAAFPAGALTSGGRAYAAFKVNGNFPGNPAHRGLPTIQGVIVLCDAETGEVLALLDSGEVTLHRTAAASAVAAQRLALPDSDTVTICGCGDQGAAQFRALRDVLPLTRGYAWDREPARAARIAVEASAADLAFEPATDLTAACRESQVIVTATTATEPFLTAAHVLPGTFIAAVGADYPTKGEIAPDLMAKAKVVVDSLEQCRAMGDLRRAIESGAMNADDVHAELGDVLAGRRPGRTDIHEITLFDSTGKAVQDVASAAVIFERASETRSGRTICLGQ